MHIVLLILKILGIILLVLFGLLLLVLCTVLFVPVRYQISGSERRKMGPGESILAAFGDLRKRFL